MALQNGSTKWLYKMSLQNGSTKWLHKKAKVLNTTKLFLLQGQKVKVFPSTGLLNKFSVTVNFFNIYLYV